MWLKVSRVFKAKYANQSEQSELTNTSIVSRQSSSRIFKKLKPVSHGDELRAYLTEYSRASDDADPLLWWKLHSQEFPKLSKMARDYLCIAGTSAPSERAFSGGKVIISFIFNLNYFFLFRAQTHYRHQNKIERNNYSCLYVFKVVALKR